MTSTVRTKVSDYILTIQVFDVQQGRPKEVFSVATCSSVARARWRPNHKHHIARSVRSIQSISYCTLSKSVVGARINFYVSASHTCSCSQFLDNSVLVWEVRRPFIPFASFAEHSDDVTGEAYMYAIIFCLSF